MSEGLIAKGEGGRFVDWEWDVREDRVRLSPALQEIHGLHPGEFSGTLDAFLERVVPEDRERARSTLFEAYRNVHPFTCDHRILRLDGEVRMLHTRADVLSDEQGKVVKLVGVCLDTTELWRAAEARDQAVSLLRATLASTADGVLVSDREGKVTAYNRRLLDLWNVSPADMEGRDLLELFDFVRDELDDPEAALQKISDLAAHPEAESREALLFRDGRQFELYSRPQRIRDQIVGRVWSYRDVTERERIVRAAVFLSDASRLLASLDVEKALEAVAHLALTHLADACAVDLFTGGDPRRLLVLSRDPDRPMPTAPPPVGGAAAPSIHNVAPTSYITVPLTHYGELLGMMTFAAPHGRRYGDHDLEVAAALGRRVELALENAQLYREARDALAARDEFLSVAAHEIRGPVTSLHLAVQGLLERPPADAAEKMLRVIEKEDMRLARFVEELLDVARIRGRKLHFVFGPVDLVDVVHDTVSSMTAELTRSGSSLAVSAPGELIGTWDRTRLEQVVTNLLSNAIKFGLGKPIEVRVEEAGGAARLSVRDQGIGIPAEAQARVFSPFERAVSTRHYGGLGLGLYIVKTIVEALGGTVRMDSHLAAGSTFTVELPLERRA